MVAKFSDNKKAPFEVGNSLPNHVAIIMDGNGRWAEKRWLPRQAGHVRGIAALRDAVVASHDLGISYLTVYAFSTENWHRPPSEVLALMALFRKFFHSDLDGLQKNNVRVRFIGRRTGLDPDIAGLIDQAETMTEENTGLNFTIAFNYGARDELVMAAHALTEEVVAGQLDASEISESVFERYLQTAGFPDVDLVIRLGGEKRISNFLLWQTAYAEFIFLDLFWPDFDKEHFEAAVREYARRDRRYGHVGSEERPVAELSVDVIA